MSGGTFESETDARIRTALGYMDPHKIAQYLGVPIGRVEDVRGKTPYCKVKGLRDKVKGGRR